MVKVLKIVFLFCSVSLSAQDLGFGLEQINGKAAIDAGLTGKGVKVGIIDGGFLRANETPSLQSFFKNDLVAFYKNYIKPKAADYSGSAVMDDLHGTEVWELIGGYNEEKEVQYGLATGATYYLAVTDHGAYEKRVEEQLAIEAMEQMAEEGVRIINLSLGYNYGYSDPSENYEPEQMDGKTTEITKAVDRLSKTHGILFVVAAGNDGSKHWEVIGAPADAEQALTVGSTNLKVWDKSDFSSIGPPQLTFVKPEVSCYSSLGTSFSAPIISGLAACLLEQNPALQGSDLKKILLASSHLNDPNNHIGYGVPDAAKAIELASGEPLKSTMKRVVSEKRSYKLVLEQPSIYVKIYHKKGWQVIEEERIKAKQSIKIKAPVQATSTTVVFAGGSMEVIWSSSP